MRTNRERLVKIAVQGKIAYPVKRDTTHAVDGNGVPFALPGIGGITYNVKVGDCVSGWAADHVEPGVSLIVDEKDRSGPLNRGFNFYACVGNEAVVVSGDAKGGKGVVIGHHGGAEHVIVDFPQDVIEKLTFDDKVLIKGYGQGLELLDYPDVKVYNLDPDLLEKMGIEEKDGKLRVPVAAKVPGYLMGSGVGSPSTVTGDYDIMTLDRDTVKEFGLDKLRFGDFVAIMDHDNTYGRAWRKGAVTIGIVIHSDCRYAGHGPGVTTLMSSAKPIIEPVISEDANIGKILGIGKWREA